MNLDSDEIKVKNLVNHRLGIKMGDSNLSTPRDRSERSANLIKLLSF